ncbi:MAG: hypothetical protein ACOYNI_11140 [Acidimicrobiia bacterium]
MADRSDQRAPVTAAHARRTAAAFCAAVELGSIAVLERRAALDDTLASCADPTVIESIVDDVLKRLKREHPVAAGWVLHDAGRRAASLGDTAVALGNYAHARELLANDMSSLAAVALDTADLLIEIGDLDSAAFHLENARAYWTVAGTISARGDAGFMLGDVLAASGREREASEAYATAAVDYERAGLEHPAVRCRELAAAMTAR